MNETTDEHGSVFICTTNVQILVRRSKIFSPRRREEREEKRFQKLCVLRVFAVDFLGCGWAALCSSVVAFCAIYADENPCSLRRIFGVRPRPPYSKPPYSDEIQDLLLCEAGEPDKQGCCCPLRIGAAQDVCSRAAPGRSAKTQSLIPIDQSAPALPRLHVRNCWRRRSHSDC